MTNSIAAQPNLPDYDVVVVGGGPAGLSGAVALGRMRRRVLVVDAGSPRNAPAGGVHNYLTRDGIPPHELAAAGRAEVTAYGGHLLDGTVVSAERLPDHDAADGHPYGFRVRLADGREVQARRLLVTTGLVDELPAVAGLAERWGRDVLHCPYCHGWEVRDRAVGVLNTSPMAVHQALLWRQLTDDVVLFGHDGPEPSEEQWEELAARGIAVVDGQVAALEVRDDALAGLRLADGRVVAREALAVATRLRVRTEVLSGLGLEPVPFEAGGMSLGTRVPASPTGATSVPGVWVAGNVTDPMGQVITSAAAGLMAGAQLNFDLVSEDTARAVQTHRSRYASALPA